MKGCILLQRNFSKVGHTISIILKEKYSVDDMCAYVTTRSSYNFLKNQTDLQYSQLLLDENIQQEYKKEKLDLNYIKKLEREHGIPNLWPYVMVDRVIMQGQLIREYPYNNPQYNHEDILKMVQIYAKKIIKFLNEEKPDFIFFSVVGNIGTYLLYQIAKKRGIKIFFGELSRFPDSYMITNDFSKFNWAEDKFKKFQNKIVTPDLKKIKQAQKIISQFQIEPKPYHHAHSPKEQPIYRYRQFKFLFPSNWLKTIYWFFWSWHQYLIGNHKKDYSTIKPWFQFWDRFIRKLRVLYGYENLYDEINDNDDFVYYPLNAEPEMFLLLYAPFATDQLHTIKQLARSLPLHYKLYVKEHPVMVGYRTRKFYKELKKMPNVKLIHPKTISFNLIKKSKLVATTTGTAGWEAIVLKKPVITFGYNFYHCLSMVKYCENIHKLPYLIKDQLENFQYNENELINFVVALLDDTVPVDMLHLWEEETDFNIIKKDVEPLVDLIAKKLNINN